MSLCSHTVRAISRSRIPKPNTLLPFLYQTATIQQWEQPTRAVTRRTIASRSRPRDDWPVVEDVPFEDADGNLPPTVEEVESPRKTTMTDTERAAFEKLYKTFNAHGQRQNGEDGEHEELDQIADEYYEDDENDACASLDKVFDDVLYRSPRLLQTQRNGKNMTHTPRPSEFSADTPDTPQNKKKLAAKAESERIRKLRIEERERIDKLMKDAQTDRELWDILNREVFDQLRKLDLDHTPPRPKKEAEPKKTKGPKTRGKSTSSTTSQQATRILFPNYPHHLLTALQLLRINFPRSSLPLTLLPTIKSLGRSSYALGATPQLYKHLLRTAWIQQSSYTLIDTLLTDMDANIVDFDMDILEFIDGVIREHEAAVAGQLGKELQMVFGLEMWGEGIGKIVEWRKVVAKRLGVSEEVKMKKVRPVQPVVEHGERNGDRSVIKKIFVDKRGAEGRDGETRLLRFDKWSRGDDDGEKRLPRFDRRSKDDVDGEHRPPRSDRRNAGSKDAGGRPPRGDRQRNVRPAKKVDDFVPLSEGRQPVGPVRGEETPTTLAKSHGEAKERMNEQKTAEVADDAPKVLL